MCLDGNIDEVNDDDCGDCIMKLRQIVNTVNIFNDVDECIDFIIDIKEKPFIIISGEFHQAIISTFQDITQMIYIYIFCEKSMKYKEWSKVSDVYTAITYICEAFKRKCNHDYIHIIILI